ncbi:hypothetical protein GRI69_09980 [Erythrobacter vulgaris]|uniref:YbjN domain-containing protein n=1 Tax=Qipengyuania vulgaris TaxID=291985 RepID=A0A844XSL9_9SPHN|nr:YbjN domain-containing protein [Qipengyuania vulgaris]MXO48586.1 hypothetical protein [Qipengyuania vulgaris]
MAKIGFIGALCIGLITASSPATAQNVVADVDQIAAILESEGYQAKLIGEKDDRYIKTGMSGYNFLILPFDCDDAGENCKSVQFYIAFATETEPTLEAMNTYASRNRFGRIYLDDDRDPVIEMDIDLEAGGMPKELFMDNLAYWEAIMVAFAEFSLENDRK